MAPPSPPPAQLASSGSQKYRSPSYYRQQARRRAQRGSLTDTNVNIADEVKCEEVEIAEEVIQDLASADDISVSEEVRTDAGSLKAGADSARDSDTSSSEEEGNVDVNNESAENLGEQLKAII